MRISIDAARCEGHGRCWDTAPELVGDDEAGRGVIKGDGTVPAGLEEQASTAVRACPEQAIVLSD